MIENSLKVLAATTPKITFRTYREAAEKITSLETALGLPASKPIVNIGRAAARIAELESMVAARTAASVPAIVPVKAAPAPVMAKFGRERFNESTAKDLAGMTSQAKNPHLTGRARFCAENKVSYK